MINFMKINVIKPSFNVPHFLKIYEKAWMRTYNNLLPGSFWKQERIAKDAIEKLHKLWEEDAIQQIKEFLSLEKGWTYFMIDLSEFDFSFMYKSQIS